MESKLLVAFAVGVVDCCRWDGDCNAAIGGTHVYERCMVIAVVDEYEKAMNTADKSFETLWFNAEHAFANPSNSLFNSDAASKAKAASTKFLSNHLLK